jgi:hypothetical protein
MKYHQLWEMRSFFNLGDRPEGIFKEFLREIGLYFVDFSRKNFLKSIGKVSLWN